MLPLATPGQVTASAGRSCTKIIHQSCGNLKLNQPQLHAASAAKSTSVQLFQKHIWPSLHMPQIPCPKFAEAMAQKQNLA